MRREPRYRGIGELPHGAALSRLRGRRLMVIEFVMEGGANVVTKQVAAGVPIIVREYRATSACW